MPVRHIYKIILTVYIIRNGNGLVLPACSMAYGVAAACTYTRRALTRSDVIEMPAQCSSSAGDLLVLVRQLTVKIIFLLSMQIADWQHKELSW